MVSLRDGSVFRFETAPVSPLFVDLSGSKYRVAHYELGPDARRKILFLLGTGAGSAAIASDTIDVALRMYPAHICADRRVALCVPFLRPPESIGDVVHVYQREPESSLEVDERSELLPPSAVLARAVRRTSGLSTTLLADLFPIERESYQRWISGATSPSAGNFRRLTTLHRFFEDLASRTDRPGEWLLAALPVTQVTPYDLLKEGRLTEVWGLVQSLRAPTYERYRNADGEWSIRIPASIGPLATTQSYEYEDFED
jgi:hypothetical protein